MTERRPDPQELLWQLSLIDEDPEGSPIDAETLRAYHDGELDPEDSAKLEERLRESAAARRTLAEGMRTEDDRGHEAATLDRVRAKLNLSGTEVPAIEGAVRGTAPGRGWWRLAAAAILLLTVIFVYRGLSPSLPEDDWIQAMTFDIQVEGEQQYRSQAGSTVAYADTRVRFTIESAVAPAGPIEFALFRRRGDTVVRLTEADGVTTDPYRGAALISATGRAILGEEAGRYELYIVVAPVGRMPGDQILSTGETPATRLKTPSTQVLPQTLQLLTSEQPRAAESANETN